MEQSRKWREATSRKLDAMTTEERLNYLRQAGEDYAAARASRRARRKLAVPAVV